MKRAIGILILAFSLASCTTFSEKQYDSLVTKLAASPRLQKNEIEACKRKYHNSRQSVRKNLAVVTGVDPDKGVSIFCNRMIKAFAKNKVTYEDFVAARRGQITPRLLKLVQGKG